jgi:hypothetical protein
LYAGSGDYDFRGGINLDPVQLPVILETAVGVSRWN